MTSTRIKSANDDQSLGHASVVTTIGNPRAAVRRDCVIAGLLSVILSVFVLQLWKADLTVPFSYLRDSVALGATVKGIIENTSFLSNPALGAPYGQSFADYPITEYLHLASLKILGLLGPNYAWAMNVYFLISIPFTAIVSTWVLRSFGLSTASSIFASLLFSFLPFRFYRGTSHLFYAAYHAVPVAMYAALRLAMGKTVVERSPDDQRRFWRRGDVWATAGLVFVLGGTGIYAVFFTLFFVAVGACYGASRHKTVAPLWSGGVIAAGLLACTVVATLPTIFYAHEHGPNGVVADRTPAETELYGLRIAHLMMPIPDHRIGAFASFRKTYDVSGTAIPVNENGWASPGLIGAAGCLLLLISLVVGFSRFQYPELLSALTTMNVLGLLLATIGGLSAWVAVAVTPKIRGYNRIAPYLAFLAFTAVAITLDTLLRKRGVFHRIILASMPVLLIGGILDQTSPAFVPDYAAVKREFTADAQFVAALEKQLPAGAMIFELPYAPWPEHPDIHSLDPYQLLRGYLHSHHLRWSYAAMKGRPGDAWIRDISSRPVVEMVDTLAAAGFSGIYIDLRGYSDTTIESALVSILGQQPLKTKDGFRLFFPLVEYTRKLRSAYSEGDWDRLHRDIMYPAVASWADGCSPMEADATGSQWRWCGNLALLTIHNTDTAPRSLRVAVNVTTGSGQPSILRIAAPGLSRTMPISANGPTPVSFPVSVSPGVTKIYFRSDAAPAFAPLDNRKLVLRFTNFEVTDVNRPANLAWEAGCSQQETKGLIQWRWCTGDATLKIENQTNAEKQIAVHLVFRPGVNETAKFELSGFGTPDTVNGGPGVISLRRVLSVPPGVARIRVHTDAKPLQVADDTRSLVFAVDQASAFDLSSARVIYAN